MQFHQIAGILGIRCTCSCNHKSHILGLCMSSIQNTLQASAASLRDAAVPQINKRTEIIRKFYLPEKKQVAMLSEVMIAVCPLPSWKASRKSKWQTPPDSASNPKQQWAKKLATRTNNPCLSATIFTILVGSNLVFSLVLI